VDAVASTLAAGVGLVAVAIGLTFLFDRLRGGPADVAPELVIVGGLAGQLGLIAPGPTWWPLAALAIGAVGVMTGGSARLAVSEGGVRHGLIDAAFIGTTVTAVCAALLQPRLPAWEAARMAVAVGCVAAAGSGSAAAIVAQRQPELGGPLSGALAAAGRTSGLAAVGGFGLLMAGLHQPTPPWGPSDWLLATLLMGGGLAWLLVSLTPPHSSEGERGVALVAVLCVAVGLAGWLGLAAITVAAGLGLILAITPTGAALSDELAPLRRVAVRALLLLAGLWWTPVPLNHALPAIAALSALRWVGTWASGWLASVGTAARRDLGRGALSQGEVAIALALSFRLTFDGELAALLYTAMLGSILLHLVVSPRLLEGLLVDAGALRQAPPLAPEEG
jgi:hypothetical protein